MKIESIRVKRRRILSGFLAFVCLCVSVFPFYAVMKTTTIVSRAKTFSGKNIWSGGSETLFGHSRNYLYRWKDNYQLTFCISPGKHMGVMVTSNGIRTSVDDAEIPYIRSTEDYQLLADICYWVDHHGSVSADNATYAAAQAAVWAVIGDGWESADAMEALVDKHVPGTLARWQQLKAYIERSEACRVPIPDWVQTSRLAAQESPLPMKQDNGVWKLELDISSLPQLAACAWDFGENAAGWSAQVLNGKLIFTYNGGQPPAAVASTPIPDSLADWAHNTETLNIYLPVSNASTTQIMISAAPVTPKVYIGLTSGGSFDTETESEQELELVIYEHRETFTSHYQIGLAKYCAETGQTLEGAQFRVLEAFDGSEITAPLDREGMATRPAVWDGFRICGEAVTDADGHFDHCDTKKYTYVKTYCDGHPKPTYVSAEEMFPEADGSDADYEEVEQAVDAQNEKLDAQWQELVDLCASYHEGSHFHHVEPGMAKEEMLADRDAAYEGFIGLTYEYTFEEIRARYGYTRHGQHKDDIKIPVYAVSSLEAGGRVVDMGSRDITVNEDVGYIASYADSSVTGENREEVEEARDIRTEFGQSGQEELLSASIHAEMPEIMKGMRPVVKIEEEDAWETEADEIGETEEEEAAEPVQPETPEGMQGSATDDGEICEATPSDADEKGITGQPDSTERTVSIMSNADRQKTLRYSFAALPEEMDEEKEDMFSAGALPAPVPDDLQPITPYSTEGVSVIYIPVSDHRTEGEIHINKRDILLRDGEHDGYDSYADTQGDATLEGAVYGLYAAEDILHPDGKTGVVYRKGALTAIASTDKNGDASFMAYTEEGELARLTDALSGAGYSAGSIPGYRTLRSWIGRPLIAGRYLVREIARSEGYELTIDPAAMEGVQTVGRADVTSAMYHPIDMHDGYWLEFDVTYENTAEGFDVLVSGFPAGSSFSRSYMESKTETEDVVVGVEMVPTGEYEIAEPGEFRIGKNGGYIPVTENGKPVYDTLRPVMQTCFVTQRIDFYPSGEFEIIVDPSKWSDPDEVDADYICEELNAMLKQMGYTLLAHNADGAGSADKAPWTVVSLTGTSNQEMIEKILEWFGAHTFWSSVLVDGVWEEDGQWKARILHDYPGGSAVYEARTKILYVKLPVRTSDGERHVYVPYPEGAYALKNGYATVKAVRQKEGEIPFGAVMDDWLENAYEPLYERYGENEPRLDGNGNPIPVYKEQYITGKSQNTTTTDKQVPLAAVYDAVSGCYRIHIENTVNWDENKGPQIMTIRAKAPATAHADSGQEPFYSDYLVNVKGAGAGAFACVRGGEPEGLVELVYPGQVSASQDGAGVPGKGTRLAPVGVGERIISQSVKVIKTVNRTDGVSGGAVPNFRFKAYLKSNLERLYRDAEGNVVWLDRQGNVIDIGQANKAYPAIVPNIYTKVERQTAPLYKQTADAVIANASLYSEGETEPLAGYTAVLETVEKEAVDGDGVRTVRVPNYEKFFDAITVANYDLWDDSSPELTSHRPLGNTANRSNDAEENAEFTDMVRQFAIDWYLDGEVAVMEKETETAYGDRFYDEALRRALAKADLYLKPFFNYDLDEIYAVLWDSDAAGGADANPATLSADTVAGDACFGISAALPYGTYVVVEQQPHYAGLKDFDNRHYRIDSPKEVVVPSVYLATEEEGSDDALSAEYIYQSSMTMEEMTGRYGIRFGSEIRQAAGREIPYVTDAHNDSGDFEIYKYGVDIGLLSNGVHETGKEGYFALTQDAWKPYQNYYNDSDDRSGHVTYYLSCGKSGREAVGQVYRYSSVAESAGIANGVAFAGGTATEENPAGIFYRDGVKTMSGVKTAYEGLYSPMFVPVSPGGSVTPDGGSGGNSGSSAPGAESALKTKIAGDGSYARVRFVNTPYEAKLRIEKMDSETGENLLHDDAVFNIYRAVRDESPDGEGRVRFYDEDTMVFRKSREFLESMGASEIRLMSGSWYQGVIPAGTPVCEETARIYQTDAEGVRIGEFRSFTTVRDGALAAADDGFAGGFGQQNAGWLETPEPLAAGVYVLAEVKAPAGYVRSRPIAIEVYSDRVTYYQRGTEDSRVTATVYASTDVERASEEAARVYVENTPTRLLVEKRKEASAESSEAEKRTMTARISGRIDGNLAEIGGDSNYEYAYRDGVYMGYAWRKGTLEYLKALKDAGMDVEIVYQGNLFAGYGYITQELATADDVNGYVTGALMTLYEGLELTPSGGSQDMAYQGLEIVRSGAGNVTRMYVKEGYAGFRTEFTRIDEQDGETASPGGGASFGEAGDESPKDIWSARKIDRGDTDILFYDLGGLDVFRTDYAAGRILRYGYDRSHRITELQQLEDDKENVAATDGSQSIFAFRNGVPVLEFAGGDFTQITYSAANKVFEGKFARPERQPDGTVRMSGGVVLYHLDSDGSRDSLVDPYTGMAYTLAAGEAEEECGPETPVRVLVWPVTVARDAEGHLLAQDKITTSRIATLGTDKDTEYLTGTWQSENSGQSHQMFSLTANRFGQNMNGEPVLTGNNGAFEKSVYPVYDSHGMVLYYRYSGESYETELPLYDRSGRKVREKQSDLQTEYDEASYVMREDRKEDQEAAGTGGGIYHRAGESYILENTWLTGESAPDDPFADELTEGQADLLRRVPVGIYIMEELAAPEGYGKGLPTGVVVEETAAIQRTVMTDKTTKLLVGKADGTENNTFRVLDMLKTDASGTPQVLGTVTEGAGRYSGTQLSGARLALYEAERVYTSDLTNHPDGTYLRKKGGEPLTYHSTNSRPGAEETLRAEWTSGETPLCLEAIPAGEYLLEELEAPPGMVSAPAREVTVGRIGEMQTVILYNDHTKLEIEKYTGDGAGENLVSGAQFTLYKAKTGSGGQVVYDDNGWPAYDPESPVDQFTSDDGGRYTGFIRAFEEQYAWWGTGLREVSWTYGGQTIHAQYASHTQIDVSEARIQEAGALAADGQEAGTSAAGDQETGISEADDQESGISVSGLRSGLLAAIGRESTGNQFPTTAEMVLLTDDGAEIRVNISEQGKNLLGQNRVYTYRFDYHALPDVNSRASSYLTESGMRRLDYLPVGADYVLVETAPPDGFAASVPVLIRVRDLADVQRYRIRNEEGAVTISKTYSDSGKELPGTKLALYRAAADGGLIREDAYLAAVWTSGRDGRYTEEDRINGLIPKGYEVGDLRPHTLTRLPEGDYWLVELASPAYYTTFEPVKIAYHVDDPVRIVRVSDLPAKGRVTVRKTDSEGNDLQGAVFELSAYCQPDLQNPVFTKRFGDIGGIAALEELPVGEIQADGSIIAYCYRLREVIPPDGYAVNPRSWTFEFLPDKKGVSYVWGEAAEYSQTVVDQKTRVTIRKKDFGELYVNGAELTVYPVTGADDNGRYLYDEDSPVASWVTSETEPDHMLEGLIAGRSYLLAETQVPQGYEQMKPVVFSLSADGRRIASLGGHMAVITVHDLYTATLRGRYVLRGEMTVTDSKGRKTASWTSSGSGRVLTEKDGIRDGEIYTLTETTFYSDGSAQTVSRRTGRVSLSDGGWRVEDRWPERVYLRLRELIEEDAEAQPVIAAYAPSEERPELAVGDASFGKELFSNRTGYVLEETTYYSDGSSAVSGRLAFEIGDDGSVTALAGYDRKRQVTVSKTDITGQKEVPGARLQILDAEGNIVEEWVSVETPHPVAAVLTPGESYTLREILSPDGYAYAADITFTVSEEGIEEQVVMADTQTRVLVTKTDITGEKELSGAKMQIFELEEEPAVLPSAGETSQPSDAAAAGGASGKQPDKTVRKGRLTEEWISAGEPHEIVGKLTAGKSYILHEETAPAGYACAEDIIFRVSRNGSIDRVTMRDEALPHRTRKPREPEPKKPGTVEAEYQVFLIDSAGVPLSALIYGPVPETGDSIWSAAAAALFLMICSAVMCGVFWNLTGGDSTVYQEWKQMQKKRRSASRRHGRFMVWLVFGLAAALAGRISVRASEMTVAEESVVSATDTEITVRYDTYAVSVEEAVQMPLPPDACLWQGEEYRLKAFQTVSVPLPELTRYARESVLYEGVEQAATVPESIDANLWDEDSGRSAVVMLPLESTQEANGRWADGFIFPVTVWGYENGSFILGGETVQVKEEHPFAGYESSLLELIGVDPAYYQIDTVEWSGAPQTGENGLIYRQATASGRKYVMDITAVYGGQAVIPEQPGMAYEAVYEKAAPESEPETEEETEGIASPSAAQIQITPPPVPAASALPEESAGLPGWIRTVMKITAVVFGLGFLLFPFFLIFLLRRKKRKQAKV